MPLSFSAFQHFSISSPIQASKWTRGPDGWFYDAPPPPPPPPGHTYVWITSDDDRTCDLCAPLHGTRYDESWTIFPPLHPNCRCTIALIPHP